MCFKEVRLHASDKDVGEDREGEERPRDADGRKTGCSSAQGGSKPEDSKHQWEARRPAGSKE